jgi:hypothetical protein
MVAAAPLTAGCLCGGVRFSLATPPDRTWPATAIARAAYAAPWEPIPGHGIERFEESRPR